MRTAEITFQFSAEQFDVSTARTRLYQINQFLQGDPVVGDDEQISVEKRNFQLQASIEVSLPEKEYDLSIYKINAAGLLSGVMTQVEWIIEPEDLLEK